MESRTETLQDIMNSYIEVETGLEVCTYMSVLWLGGLKKTDVVEVVNINNR